jgi:BlaI family penicillinase repressor
MKLSDFEIEVMHLLWQEQESTASNIHQLIKAKRIVAYSTVKTILDRLVKKGAVDRSKTVGRTICFSPLLEKKDFRQHLIKAFVDKVFLGKTKPIISYILKEENLSLRDIEFLEAILLERKKTLS